MRPSSMLTIAVEFHKLKFGVTKTFDSNGWNYVISQASEAKLSQLHFQFIYFLRLPTALNRLSTGSTFVLLPLRLKSNVMLLRSRCKYHYEP